MAQSRHSGATESERADLGMLADQLLETLIRYPHCEDDTDRSDMAKDRQQLLTSLVDVFERAAQSRPVKDAATGERAAWAVRVLNESAARHARKSNRLGSWEMQVATTNLGELGWSVDVPGYEISISGEAEESLIGAAEMLVREDPTLAVPFVPASTPAGQWIRAHALPSWLSGLCWLRFEDGSVSTRPAFRDNGAWFYDNVGTKEHAPVIAYCPAMPPPAPPLPPAPESAE
jgi:hypothetical protein